MRPGFGSALLAIAAGLIMPVLAVSTLERYGFALFFATSFGVAALTAFLLKRRYPATGREIAKTMAMALALTAGADYCLAPRAWSAW